MTLVAVSFCWQPKGKSGEVGRESEAPFSGEAAALAEEGGEVRLKSQPIKTVKGAQTKGTFKAKVISKSAVERELIGAPPLGRLGFLAAFYMYVVCYLVVWCCCWLSPGGAG